MFSFLFVSAAVASTASIAPIAAIPFPSAILGALKWLLWALFAA